MARRYAPRMPLEERRPLLLDAALEVIVERGYAGATLTAIAERAGVTKPVIYDAFPDRDAFFAALLDREEERTLGAVLAALPADTTPSAIAGAVTGLLRTIAADPAPWKLLLGESEATPRAVRARIARDRERVHAALREVVGARLAATGRADLDAGLVAHALFAATERFARMAADGDPALDPGQAGAVVAAMATGG